MTILEKQFSRPTATGRPDLTSDGCTDFFAFSTGRRVIASLHTVFTLRPRHDVFQLAYQVGWGLVDLLYTPRDDLTLDFKLHVNAAVPEFVWALVAKGEANSIRKERWDLVSKTPLSFFLSAANLLVSKLHKIRHSQRLRRIRNSLQMWSS